MAQDEATVRDRILGAVEQFPGIHFRGLCTNLQLSTALARYHLQALEQEKKVRAVEVGGFVRYFPTAGFRDLTAEERRALHVLRQARPLEIVLAMLEFGPMQHRDILDVVGGSKGTLSYQLDKLVEAGVVEKVAKGPERGFRLRDPEAVRAMLARYEPVPEVLERVHDTWDDLFGGHRAGRRRRT
jgi:predicted transcriptional regulator